jgi:hypothetical protein
MGRKASKKFYNMRGCSKTRKNYLGGSADAPLAYTGKPVFSSPNPNLAYTGKGGSLNPIPVNTNALNPTIPNTGPVPTGQIFFNSSSPQHGGSCPTCSAPSLMSGGGCGCGLSFMKGGYGAMGFMVGGKRHRVGCKCSKCKSKEMRGGNPGIPYPNGLVGTPWTSDIGSWPGANGVPGDGNYYTNNTYNNDVSRQMVDVGANSPFLNLKGGKRSDGKRSDGKRSDGKRSDGKRSDGKRSDGKQSDGRKRSNQTINKRGRKQRGGTLSNFMGQDLINLGRQFQFGVGSAYNALAGYSSPVNPMPWKDQFPSKLPFNPATI